MAKKADSEAPFFGDMVTAANKDYGSGTAFVGTDMDCLIEGVPLYPICLRWLFDSTVVPLHRIIAICGAYQSHKSTFGYELCRWIIAMGGVAVILDTEQKPSPELMYSVIGRDDDTRKRLAYMTSRDITEYESQITKAMQFMDKKDPLHQLPRIILLDSLTGSPDETTVKHIKKKGSARERDFSSGAAQNTRYFKDLTSKLIGQPTIFVMTNHEKSRMGTEDKSNEYAAYSTKRTPGGSFQDFHANWYVQMARVTEHITETQYGGHVDVNLYLNKSSSGYNSRAIRVTLYFHRDPETSQQTTWFDWNSATAVFLASRGGKYGLKDILDVSVDGGKFTSKKLGLKSARPEEFGAAVHNDPILMDALTRHFNIVRSPLWEPEEIEKAKKTKAKLDKEAEERDKKARSRY